MQRRYGTVMLGAALLGVGALLFLAVERGAPAQWLMRFWPLFLVLAGTLRVAGYFLDRHPRSPVGGMMLTAVGGVLLAAGLRGDRAGLQVFGRYWFWLLLAFVAGRVLLQYTRRPESGRRTRAFGLGPALVMLLIAGGGLAANRLAGDRLLLARLQSRFDRAHVARGDASGSRIPVLDDAAQSFDLAPGGRVVIANPLGNVEVRGGAQARAQARLIKRVRAGGGPFRDEAAGEIARKIHLRVEPDRRTWRLLVTADEAVGEVEATLILEVPALVAASIAVENAQGAVKLAQLRGDHTIRGAARAEVADNLGRVTIEGLRSGVQLTRIQGDVRVSKAAGDVSLREISGSLVLDLLGGAARVEEVTGAVRVTAEDGSVEAEEINGGVRIEATRDVSVRNFRGPLEVVTRLGAIDLAVNSELGGDLKATSRGGRIRVRLPEESSFRLDASTSSGRLRLRGFEDLAGPREEKATLVTSRGDADAPLVLLRSLDGEILIEPGGRASASRR